MTQTQTMQPSPTSLILNGVKGRHAHRERLRRDLLSLAEQARKIGMHLLTEGDISAVEAIAMYKCRSLSRRICDLKDHGWKIRRVLKNDPTGQRYARYFLED